MHCLKVFLGWNSDMAAVSVLVELVLRRTQASIAARLLDLCLRHAFPIGEKWRGWVKDSVLSPLALAVEQNMLEAVVLLIKAGAPVNEELGHSTPLLRAVKSGHVAIAAILLEHGAQPNVHLSHVFPPLHETTANLPDIDMMRLLLKHGADANDVFPGVTPLHLAISKLRVDKVRLLLDYGADPSVPDGRGSSAIDFAHVMRATEILREFAMREPCHVADVATRELAQLLASALRQHQQLRVKSEGVSADEDGSSATLEAAQAKIRREIIDIEMIANALQDN